MSNKTIRNKTVMQNIDKGGRGVEIGPSHNPVAPKKEGYEVHIIDHLSREDLIKKYKDHNVDTENIEEVDFVWQGEDFSELTGRSKYYDWIIASHVIEHTPDLIAFLNSCDSILKDDGVISLVIPDKRYCFDHYRPITGISKIIDNHLHEYTIHSPGTVAEYFLNVVAKSGSISWGSNTVGEYSFVHSLEEALWCMKSVVDENAYLDVHAWCFVPHSFRLIIHDLFCLGMIPFKEVSFSPTVGCEFYVTLGRGGKGVDKSRMELLSIIESEIMDGEPNKQTLSHPPPTNKRNPIRRLTRRCTRWLFRKAQ